MIHIGKKLDQDLCTSISGIKCDIDKPLFSTERGSQLDYTNA